MSTIHYKFRSSTNFTPLHLPGSSARLLDIKRAIVRDKNLSTSSLEFDLQISNASTNEPYDDEDSILPRGTRIVVRRIACERGRGILHRLAGDRDAGPAVDRPEQFYTFRGEDDEEDFVEHDEGLELEALNSVLAAPAPSLPGPKFPRPPPRGVRPDADPELRMQQQQQLKTKKRATGIPRTFLSEGRTDGEPADEDTLATTLLPNARAFQSLIHRAGGQSQNTSRNLSYALKLISTVLPEHLTCGICKQLAVNPMLVPWDELGRPACESCIRDGLLQNGYKCPMTGAEGVSPEDLFPNVGLRKAAELFQEGVWEKVDAMERQIEEERRADESKEMREEGGELEEEVRMGRAGKREKKKRTTDEFEDDFGGDVFDVVEEINDVHVKEEGRTGAMEEDTSKQAQVHVHENDVESTTKDNHNKTETKDRPNVDGGHNGEGTGAGETKETSSDNVINNSSSNGTTNDQDTHTNGNSSNPKKREAPKRRGPPIGYVLGPAGAGGLSATPAVMFGVNVPPPPPPPRPPQEPAPENTARTPDQEVARISNSPGPPMGRGRDGRFPGRYPPTRGSFPARGRFPQPGRRDFHQGRGFERGGPPPSNWGPAEEWNRKRPRDSMEDSSVMEGWGGRGPAPFPGRLDGRGRFPPREGRGRSGWSTFPSRGGPRGFGRGRF